MADSFAASGYTTLIIDPFNGDPVPLNNKGPFDFMKWLNEGSDGKNPHTTAQVDPIVVAGIKALRELGVDKIAAVGYCFGAKVRLPLFVFFFFFSFSSVVTVSCLAAD